MTNEHASKHATTPWAIEPSYLDMVATRPARAFFSGLAANRPSDEYEVRDGTALIEMRGPMASGDDFFAQTTYESLREQIQRATENASVDRIMLVVDSPGGSVAGLADVEDAIKAARDIKPVHAHALGTMASAAYWLAAGAERVTAQRSAMVGSIGVYSVVYDQSQQFANEGIRPLLFTTGEHKGAATRGIEITDAQKAEFQRQVDHYMGEFRAAVTAGRGMNPTQFATIADGRVWPAGQARELALVDEVMSLDDVLQELSGVATSGDESQEDPATSAQSNEEVIAMSDGTTAAQAATTPPAANITAQPATAFPVAATPKEIREACAGSDSDFIVAQIEAGATLEQALKAWAKVQAEKLSSIQKSNASAGVAEAVGGKKAKAASDDEETDAMDEDETSMDEDDDEATAAWKRKVSAKIKSGLPRHRAISAVASANPSLHAAVIAAANKRR